MPANRRKRPIRGNEKSGGGESRGEKFERVFSRRRGRIGGRNEMGRGRGALVQPSIATRPARWLLKFKDPPRQRRRLSMPAVLNSRHRVRDELLFSYYGIRCGSVESRVKYSEDAQLHRYYILRHLARNLVFS